MLPILGLTMPKLCCISSYFHLVGIPTLVQVFQHSRLAHSQVHLYHGLCPRSEHFDLQLNILTQDYQETMQLNELSDLCDLTFQSVCLAFFYQVIKCCYHPQQVLLVCVHFWGSMQLWSVVFALVFHIISWSLSVHVYRKFWLIHLLQQCWKWSTLTKSIYHRLLYREL